MLWIDKYLNLSASFLSFNSDEIPAVMVIDDESLLMSICTVSDNLVLQSLDTDTLLDWTIEIAFDAIEMDSELEKCKHLRIIFATSKKLSRIYEYQSSAQFPPYRFILYFYCWEKTNEINWNFFLIETILKLNLDI